MEEISGFDVIRPYVLVAFVVVFVGIIAYVFWPGRRGKYRRHAEIPLKDEKREKE